MPRTLAEVEADIAAAKASGAPPMSATMRSLRKERSDLLGQPPSASEPPAAPAQASVGPALDDAAFIGEALTRLLLEGKGRAGKIEQAYSDVRSVLRVKHILDDAAGLVPTRRINLPAWDTLLRERESGELYDAGVLETARAHGVTPQAVVEGLVQRGTPARTPKIESAAAGVARPGITTRDGAPLVLGRTKLNEPDGAATFLNADEAEEVATGV
jgi:hypothetical protein